MSRPLSEELLQVLHLEQHGFDYPEAVLVALEAAQEELCLDTGFEPGQVFSVGNNILQCYQLPNREVHLDENSGIRMMHSLLNYTASNRYANRIIQFNYHSGHNMVTTSTYEDCSVRVDTITVPCFSIAALSLHAQGPSMSVLLARIH